MSFDLGLSQTIKLFNEKPELMEQALNPGRQLYEFNPDDLTIEVLPSGVKSFDLSLILKKNRGELVLIGARPGQGKSALLFQLATNIARIGKSHVFSLEMDHPSVVTRQIAALIERPIDAIQRGLHMPEIIQAKEALKQFNYVIDDRANLTVEEICYSARQEYRKGKTDCIFVDYIQLIKTEKGHSRANEVALVSAQLKGLAKELCIPVVAASQLNRNSELRESKLPQLSDLKESGSLEQDADVVLLIHRDSQSPTEALVNVAKNRNGPTVELHMEYAPTQTKFIEKLSDEI